MEVIKSGEEASCACRSYSSGSRGLRVEKGLRSVTMEVRENVKEYILTYFYATLLSQRKHINI